MSNQGYSVQEVSRHSGLSPYTLRYYEKEGILKDIPRSSSGHRRFRSEDIEWLSFVTCLKGTGMNLDDIKRFAELHRNGDSRLDEQLMILQAHRNKVLQQMEELKTMLERVEGKIQWFKQRKQKI
ncbi:MerR family transcriptional regulator [Spirochaeta dissipatitropha]